MTRVLLVLLRLYQRTVSPDHGVLQPFFQGGVCRFTPTCSAYLSEALTTRGLSRGLLLGGKRLLRCHPFVSGGPDPVPQGERGT